MYIQRFAGDKLTGIGFNHVLSKKHEICLSLHDRNVPCFSKTIHNVRFFNKKKQALKILVKRNRIFFYSASYTQ